jgi:hypothetical protein
MPRTNPSPSPILKVRGVPVTLIDYHYDGAGVCWVSVRTRDGSRPFEHRCARSDPEETPYPEFVMTDWGTVRKEEITRE